MSLRPSPRAPSPAPLRGAILVGGRSQRMGRPKQLLEHDGQPLFALVAAALRPHVEDLAVVGEGEVPLGFEQLSRLEDPPGLQGPVAGLLAALQHDPDAAWLVAACDMPLVTAAAVSWLVSQRVNGIAAVLPRVDDRGVEPLLALYEPAALTLLEGLVARGVRAPHRLSGSPGVVGPRVPAHLATCWTNINRPEDLERLESGGL